MVNGSAQNAVTFSAATKRAATKRQQARAVFLAF